MVGASNQALCRQDVCLFVKATQRDLIIGEDVFEPLFASPVTAQIFTVG